MLPQKPYLLRGLYDWIVESDETPQIMVEQLSKSVSGVPAHLLGDKHLVLNISPTATQSLQIGNEYIEFETRFNGESSFVVVDIRAVVAIFSRESQEGMSFTTEKITESASNKDLASKSSADKAQASQKKAPSGGFTLVK